MSRLESGHRGGSQSRIKDNGKSEGSDKGGGMGILQVNIPSCDLPIHRIGHPVYPLLGFSASDHDFPRVSSAPPESKTGDPALPISKPGTEVTHEKVDFASAAKQL